MRLGPVIITPEAAEQMAEDFYESVAIVRRKISGLFKKSARPEAAETNVESVPTPPQP